MLRAIALGSIVTGLALGGGERPASAQIESMDIARPSRAQGATLALIVTKTRATRNPGSKRVITRLTPATSFSHQPQRLLVLRSRVHEGRAWLRVLVPIRPNGTRAWLPANRVLLSRTPYWVKLRKEARRIKIYKSGKLVHRYRAVIGTPATPTPSGLAAIYEKNRQPDPGDFLGPWSLPLTAFSDVLESFGGGPGRVAIHGRAGASLADPLGSAASHGCIRIENGPIRWMAEHLPTGTPVEIAD